jgi:hypothetical protein
MILAGGPVHQFSTFGNFKTPLKRFICFAAFCH